MLNEYNINYYVTNACQDGYIILLLPHRNDLLKRNADMKSYTPTQDANIEACNQQLAEMDEGAKWLIAKEITLSILVVTAFIIGVAL